MGSGRAHLFIADAGQDWTGKGQATWSSVKGQHTVNDVVLADESKEQAG
jgi:hypothetical protein